MTFVRQHVITAATCIALGVVTTVGVAWACGALVRLRLFSHADLYAEGVSPSSPWSFSAYRRPGAWYVVGSPVRDYESREWNPSADFLTPAEVDWPDVFLEQPPPSGYRQRQVFNARGWPFPALWCEVLEGYSPSLGTQMVPEASGGIVWEREFSSNEYIVDSDHGSLPLRPLWTGAVVDTFFFAACWAGVLVLRRSLRRRVQYLTRRTSIKAAVLCILLGLGTTLGTAWLCALLVDERLHYTSRDGSGETRDGANFQVWWVYRDSEPGALRLRSSWMARGKPLGSSGYWGDGPAEEYVPVWADSLIPTDDDTINRIVDARGWPMLAMWGGFEVRSENVANEVVYSLVDTRHAIILPRFNGDLFRPDWSRVIPLAPIWTGAFVNSLFYALIWAAALLLLVGPGVIGRTARYQRGQCPLCGYPCGRSANCTECGASVPEHG